MPERVLLVAPTGRDAALAASVLRSDQIQVTTCSDVSQAVTELGAGAGALLVAMEAMDPGRVQHLARWIARQPAWSDLPVIVFTSASSRDARDIALERLAPLGNVTLLERPLRRTTFVTVVRTALRARQRQYAARDVLVALEHEVAARDQFLAMLGHELRNPLAAIMMALQVTELRAPTNSRELGIVARQSRQLARIVDDLLDVARVTSGKIALHRVIVDLSSLVTKALEALQPEAVKSGITLAWTVPPPGLLVMGDPVRLEQVLANLVGNALKYTPRRGHVWVDLQHAGAEAVLRVRDDGSGIAPDQLRRVFETFAQVDTTLDRSRGGLGLGLTVARSLVAMHGGAIEAFSEGIGKGSEFVVRLPTAVGSSEQEPQDDARRPERRPRRILVIEDGDDNRVALKAALELMGHEVQASADGVEGAEAAIRHAPEVVLVDIGLPGLDGYEVARRIRAARGSRVLLVALTGYGQAEDRRLAIAAGFDVHLTKPVELEALAAVIREGRTRVEDLLLAPGHDVSSGRS
ncbi:ATP-binding response regulator [Anaeromyxobacter soli]|uniref:ATP-binding response regulator n=1 Tax=Anaeromyxobacter soli TaxID=2922725 RepID=UPI001FAFADFA|nr:ATP-binding protein [Anaeromyxobacter sp. SG29]